MKPRQMIEPRLPDPPDPETAFDQYVEAYHRGAGYTHLHPCVQQAIADVYAVGTGNTNYLAPRAFWRNYDEYWYKVWTTNWLSRVPMAARYPVIPTTWESPERYVMPVVRY